ncbi:hypothetical protein PV10_06730 [Exophiala mesophila]|uniref:Apoptosis regulator Bcl-2 family BH4 domain-containing protein n=1 Tax=Exophiala mesophila TaxID=212818 RepID=A0A0D1WSW5_EXOME|nr:uncharacterized protein PV10_06730 [Exophiala mesophila]KIV92275.1 hypothetical protein PV10_06730 [Exophiala mesophila]
MFSSFFPSSLPKLSFSRGWSGRAVNIPAVEIHDVEVLSDKRGRRLKHLLRLNHATFSILYNHLRFHNHTPHLLGSACLLGGDADHLNSVYEDAATNEGHDHWEDAPSEIALHDYRDFLGKRDYQRAWVDFFEDQLVLHGYDWKEVVSKFLFDRGTKGSDTEWPMFNALTSGLGHPLIHLGYAYELNSREVGMEALGLVATCYDPKLAKILETKIPQNSQQQIIKSHVKPTTDLFSILLKVHDDTRFDGMFDQPGGENLSHLLGDESLVSILVEYWSSWQIKDPTKDFAQSQNLAIALLIASASSVGGHGFDFFLVHLLTTSHAVRILIPVIEPQYHVLLVREWFLITLAIYIAQSRPEIKTSNITEYDVKGRDWEFVTTTAIQGPHKFDAHFVKACRAIKEAEKVWGETEDQYYLKAAVKFASEFDGWGGFGAEDEEVEREKTVKGG